MIGDDKAIEQQRYDKRAAEVILGNRGVQVELGYLPVYLQGPYLTYERYVTKVCSNSVIELGAGMGHHSEAVLQSARDVLITDISSSSLSVVENIFGQKYANFSTKVADMECLPFDNSLFDAVCCAGSLSYGDPQKVDAEIIRVLKPGGSVIFVDSMNHSWIYRFNRWLHYLKGNRSKSTLQRMPTTQRLEALLQHFEEQHIEYFGAISFLAPVLAKIFGAKRVARFSDWFDRKYCGPKTAFKFVAVGKGLKK